MDAQEVESLRQQIVQTLEQEWPAIAKDCDLPTVAHVVTSEVVVPLLEALTIVDDMIVDPPPDDFEKKLAVVRKMRNMKATWREVGTMLGTSRQAAWERFHDRMEN